ncbi:MAG: thioredoxin TrxC [Bdellovibrionales bacterium]|nr:thioredoxin TrxC [Bdellovibrionales bacterium]
MQGGSVKTQTICPSCHKLNKVDISESKNKQPTCGHCHTELPIHGAYSELSANELRQLISISKIPVVVDFWAPWCGPCKAFAPHFKEVAEQDAEKFTFVKVNTQDHPLAGDYYGIRGIPTLALFKNGREDKRISGAMPAPQFKEWINN